MSTPINMKETKTNDSLTTIMTDASFCPDTGASGWGIYVRNQKRLFKLGGNFKENPKCAFEAELMAIAIGVLHSVKEGRRRGCVLGFSYFSPQELPAIVPRLLAIH